EGADVPRSPEMIRASIEDVFHRRGYRAVQNIDRYRGRDGRVSAYVLRWDRLQQDLARLWSELGVATPPHLPNAKKGIMADELDPRDYFSPRQIDEINRASAAGQSPGTGLDCDRRAAQRDDAAGDGAGRAFARRPVVGRLERRCVPRRGRQIARAKTVRSQPDRPRQALAPRLRTDRAEWMVAQESRLSATELAPVIARHGVTGGAQSALSASRS